MKRCLYCGENYPDEREVCPVDDTPLDAVRDPSSPQVAKSTAAAAPETLMPAGFPAREALVTLAVLVLCFAAQRIPLPTLAKEAAGHPLSVPHDILVLGVQPLLSGFVLVELAALLVPVWRPLRTGGPAGREKLRRASLILGLLLALGQAFFLTVAYQQTAAKTYGPGFQIVTVLILLGATAALVGLVRIVDEAGLGSGFPVLLLAFTLPAITGPFEDAFFAFQHGGLPSSALQSGTLGLVLLVGATLWFFSPYCLPGFELRRHPAELSRPACGVAPVSVLGVILALLLSLSRQYNQPPILPTRQITVVLTLIAAIGFAYLFNRPDRVQVVWKALLPHRPEGPPSIKAVMPECVLFIGLILIVQAWLVGVFGDNPAPAAIPVVLVTGIMADLIREWRARTDAGQLLPIWEIHQVYAVPPAMRLLQEQGFHPFAKGLRFRSLLQYFGPYAPVVVVVPAAEAQSAYALLEARWPVLDRPGQ